MKLIFKVKYRIKTGGAGARQRVGEQVITSNTLEEEPLQEEPLVAAASEQELQSLTYKDAVTSMLGQLQRAARSRHL